MKKWCNLSLILMPLLLVGCASTGGDEKKTTALEASEQHSLTLNDVTEEPVGVPCGVDSPCISSPTEITLMSEERRLTEGEMLARGGIETALPTRRIIYFDYDRSDIKPEFNRILEEHAAYLTQNPDIFVRLEGHADERGSREYNLALGEQRARAAKDLLMILGVYKNQLNTLSYGEEQPVIFEHHEKAWQQNRRVELVYP